MYYFHVRNNGNKIYNFDDPTKFVDAASEPHVFDDQPISAPHVVPKDDAVMQDADHEDGQGSIIGYEYGNQSSIIIIL